MKRLAVLALVLTGSLLTTVASADVAPEPCEGKAEGDACVTFDDKPGACVAVDCGGTDCGNGLECTPGGSGGAGGGGSGGSGGESSSEETSSSGGPSEPSGGGESTDNEGCSMTTAGTQRGASAFAVLCAIGLGTWLSRRRRS